MPIYTYRCSAGHEFDVLTKLDGSDAPTQCMREKDPLEERRSFGKRQLHCTQCGSYEREDGLHFPIVLHAQNCTNFCDKPVEKVIALNAKSFPGADSWRK